MDGSHAYTEEPHLLNLKVMRLSAPSLARHQAPFFLDPDPSAPAGDLLNTFRSALARKEFNDPSSISSLNPFPASKATTLRDIPISPMLSFPASFGTISLGETFTATLSLSNDSPYPVASPRLLAEMQSNTQKISVGERVAPPRRISTAIKVEGGAQTSAAAPPDGKGILDPGRSLDLKVEYEMRELGMNVLVVSVTYESSAGPRDFVKYYKFNVTAPLAIKTKVHLPTSPSSLLSLSERERIYLEVHVQNVSPGSLVFEKVELQTVPGLTRLRGEEETQRVIDTDSLAESIAPDCPALRSSGPDASGFLAPGNSKQYLFCLAPAPRPAFPAASLFPTSPNPGTVMALGRLDLVWRSAHGERGHLLTAMLNRRAPQPGVFSSVIRATIASTPPAAQGKMLNGSSGLVISGSPSAIAPPLPPKAGAAGSTATESTYELDLAVLECDRRSAAVFESTKMKLRLAIGELGPFKQPGEHALHLAIQYLEDRRRSEEAAGEVEPEVAVASGTSTPLLLHHRPSNLDSRSPGTPSRVVSPRPSTPIGYSLAPPPPTASGSTPRVVSRALPPPPPPSIPAQDEYDPVEDLFPPSPFMSAPSPFTSTSQSHPGRIGQLGSSLTILPPVYIRPLTRASSHRDESPRSSIDGERVPPPPAPAADRRKEGSAEFEIRLMPEVEGLAYIGGLRVLLLNNPQDLSRGGRTLVEWPTLGEIHIAA